ncbi:MAG: aspartate aminotransferase family protein [Desulfovibrio sp.]|uniref:aspartate aminotransferase family protein n=1 Tax=Desulfovibrio sp. 7SRBS1 TaxID=3378064 RepID=UPI003B3FE1E0
MEKCDTTMNASEQIMHKEKAVLCHTYGRYPVSVVRAEGSRMYTPEGREYVDLLAGIAVTALGHCNPEIARTIADQARKLVHVSNLFYQDEQADLAAALLETCNADKVFFCNSGAEANEAAIKLARRYMNKVAKRDAYEVITLESSFHGRTLATLTATGQAKVKDGFAPLPEGFVTVPFNDLEALRKAIGPKTAAIMVEVVQGEGGVRPLPQEFAQGIQKLCRENDILLIVDEIQTGLCRTGKFWAHQHYDLTPDIITSAKALANGLPMGAMMTTDKVAKGFEPGSHATTFGGTALVSAAALKTIQIMKRDRLDERAHKMGQDATALFETLAAAHPEAITEIRGCGLMIGIVLSFPGQEIWQALLDAGFICNLTQGNVLRLLPALTIDFADLEAFAETLGNILSARKTA